MCKKLNCTKNGNKIPSYTCMHFGPAVVDNATKDIKIVFVVADHYYQQ